MIFAFHTESLGPVTEQAFRAHLLQKAADIIHDRSPEVQFTNFSTSWADGLGFSHLLAYYVPSGIDLGKLAQAPPLIVLESSFKLSLKHLQVPLLLTTTDMLSGFIDEYSVLTYLAVFFECTDAQRKKYFAPAPQVPISSRVLMDRLMV